MEIIEYRSTDDYRVKGPSKHYAFEPYTSVTNVLLAIANNEIFIPFLNIFRENIVTLQEQGETSLKDVFPSKFVTKKMLLESNAFEFFQQWAMQNDIAFVIYDADEKQFLRIKAMWGEANRSFDATIFKPFIEDKLLPAIDKAKENGETSVDMNVHEKQVITYDESVNSQYLIDITAKLLKKGISLSFYEHEYLYPHKIVKMKAKASWEKS
jgi:hypothetical protein